MASRSRSRYLRATKRNTLKHNRGTHLFEAGNIRFGLEMRRLAIWSTLPKKAPSARRGEAFADEILSFSAPRLGPIDGHPVTALSRGHPALTAIRSGTACAPPAIVRLHAYCGAVPVPRVWASEEVRHARSRGHRWAGRDAAGRRGHGRRGAGREDRSVGW